MLAKMFISGAELRRIGLLFQAFTIAMIQLDFPSRFGVGVS
jgi:hypothetical protein